MIYDPPSARGFVPRRVVFSTWTDLLPVGFDLVASARPDVLVELGVYKGLSYFTFCQAVRRMGLSTRCFGIDTWEGDEHVSRYGEHIHADVRAHNDQWYSEFSTLLRMTFNEAVDRFDDASVDFIHLDGLHTYEAVREDFETWFPKLRPGGLFLFHDVRTRLPRFGVWRFWEELVREHETFAFDHGYGLGILRREGGGRDADPDLIRLMFCDDPEEKERLRAYYQHAAVLADLERKHRRRGRREESTAAVPTGAGTGEPTEQPPGST